MIVKKYSNRRLYDTEASRYITLEELADRVRKGADVRVIDAATDADLTQATLAQIILEGRGAAHLLPVPLLLQLIRMQDDALAEFFGRYLTWALDAYLRTRQASGALSGLNPWLGETLSQLGRWAPAWPFGGPGGAARPAAAQVDPARVQPEPQRRARAPEPTSDPWQTGEPGAEPQSWRQPGDAARDDALAASHRAHEAESAQEMIQEWIDVSRDRGGADHAGPSAASEIAVLRQELAELRSAFAGSSARKSATRKASPAVKAQAAREPGEAHSPRAKKPSTRK
jgi:polyhydroxyalkanoate synthesis repressor PhaR